MIFIDDCVTSSYQMVQPIESNPILTQLELLK